MYLIIKITDFEHGTWILHTIIHTDVANGIAQKQDIVSLSVIHKIVGMSLKCYRVFAVPKFSLKNKLPNEEKNSSWKKHFAKKIKPVHITRELMVL